MRHFWCSERCVIETDDGMSQGKILPSFPIPHASEPEL